jgi:hypothetical protein
LLLDGVLGERAVWRVDGHGLYVCGHGQPMSQMLPVCRKDSPAPESKAWLRRWARFGGMPSRGRDDAEQERPLGGLG